MRIAVFSEGYFPEVSGVTIAVSHHLRYLSGRGHEVMFFHPAYPPEVSSTYPDPTPPEVKSLVFPSEALTPDRPESRSPTPAAVAPIRTALSEFRPELMVYHSADRLVPELQKFWKKAEIVGVTEGRRLGAKVVPIVHTLLPLYIERGGPWYWNNPVGLRIARKVWSDLYNKNFEMAVTVDSHTATYLQSIGFRVPLLAGAYNGVDDRIFRPVLRKMTEKIRICMVGRLATEKNMFLLPALADALRDKPVEITVVGAGPLQKPLQDYLGGRVRMLGWCNSEVVAREMAAADLYLSLSDTETYSLTASEALASGLPVVAPRALAFKRLDNLGVGQLFPAGWLDFPGMKRLAEMLLTLAPKVPVWSEAAVALAPSLSWDAALGRLYGDLGRQLDLNI